MKKISKLGLSIGTIGAILAPVAAVVSCGSGGSADVGFTNYNFADTFMQTVQKGIKDAASKSGTSLNIGDAKNDASTQMQLVNGQIANGAKGLLVNLVEPTNAGDYLDLAKSKKIPIVLVNKEKKDVMNTKISAGVKAAYVGSNPSESGTFQAQLIYGDLNSGLIKNRTSGDSKAPKIDLVILGGQKNHADSVARTKQVIIDLVKLIQAKGINAKGSGGSTTLSLDSKNNFVLEAGLTEAQILAAFNGIGHNSTDDGAVSLTNGLEWVEDHGGAPVRWSAGGGKATLTALDQNRNKLDIVIGNNDDTALGASDYYFNDDASNFPALNNKSKINAYIAGSATNYMPIYGIDNNDSAQVAIKAGKFAGTVKQDGEGIGKVAFQAIKDLMDGKKLSEASLHTETNIAVKKDSGSESYRVAYVAMTRDSISDDFK